MDILLTLMFSGQNYKVNILFEGAGMREENRKLFDVGDDRNKLEKREDG